MTGSPRATPAAQHQLLSVQLEPGRESELGQNPSWPRVWASSKARIGMFKVSLKSDCWVKFVANVGSALWVSPFGGRRPSERRHLRRDRARPRLQDPHHRRHCPGRKPPLLAVKHPPRPYKSAIQNLLYGRLYVIYGDYYRDL